MNLIRVQIMLEPRQHQALQKAAQRTKKSLSQLMREITDDYISQIKPEEDEVLQALDNLRKIREKQPLYTGDLVAEIRTERERQLGDTDL